MAIKVGINGFGRIGRLVFRRCKELGGFDFVGINDLTDAKTLAHLLKYDSVHGKYNGTIKVDGNDIIVDGDRIKISAENFLVVGRSRLFFNNIKRFLFVLIYSCIFLVIININFYAAYQKHQGCFGFVFYGIDFVFIRLCHCLSNF